MSSRDIVVIGASAGGVEALRSVVGGLAPDLAAAVFVVLHIPRSTPSALPAILGRSTPLHVRAAVNGEPIRQRRVYVAPVDRHLLIADSVVRLSRGPAENGHRPAVDPLFRSAARSFGSRVIGVVLSGSRDDGAVGLASIGERGGVTIAQDPSDAIVSSMPAAAIEYAHPDHVLAASEIGPVISSLVGGPGSVGPVAVDRTPASEVVTAETAEAAPDASDTDALDGPAGYGCPACGGSLFTVTRTPVARYRCRIGHAWSPDSLLAEQAAALEGSLWMALRTLEERAALSRYIAEMRADPAGARTRRYSAITGNSERAAALIRRLIEDIGTASGDILDSAAEG